MHAVKCVSPNKSICDNHPVSRVPLSGVHLQSRGLKVHQQSTKLKKGRVLSYVWLFRLK